MHARTCVRACMLCVDARSETVQLDVAGFADWGAKQCLPGGGGGGADEGALESNVDTGRSVRLVALQ